MKGEVLSLSEMDTGRIFNSMKMFFNHLAERYKGQPVWFVHRYEKYEKEVLNSPRDMARIIALFIVEIERRKDLPLKYKEPYELIARQFVKQSFDLVEVQEYLPTRFTQMLEGNKT